MTNTARPAQPAKPSQGQPAKPSAPIVKKDKAQLFKELAPKRTRVIIKAIGILGNCSNRSGYEYTPEQVAKIFDRIQKELNDTRDLFNRAGKSKELSFDL